MTEKRGPDRTSQKCNSERREGSERGGRRVGGRKEQVRKNQNGSRGIDVEIEKLDRGPDQACEQDLARAIDGFMSCVVSQHGK